MITEIWKDVVGYEGYYMVSDLGNVKSLTRDCFSNGKKIKVVKGSLIKQATLTTGYNIVGLSRNAKKTQAYVHRLVAQAFIPNPQNKPQVNHKDAVKTNNKLSNLEWATTSENMQHAHKNNLIINLFGENHQATSLKDVEVYDIKILLLAKYKQKDIACIFNTTPAVINNIHLSRTWTHVKISDRILDKYNPNAYSKPKSAPYKTSENDTRLKPIYMIDIATNNIIKEYPSTISAKKDGYNEIVLSRCLCGRRPKAYGAKWIFKSQYNNNLKTKPTLK